MDGSALEDCKQEPWPLLVADTQISAGYMHAGYPLMTQMDIVDVIVDKELLFTNKHGGTWGFYHENRTIH